MNGRRMHAGIILRAQAVVAHVHLDHDMRVGGLYYYLS